MQVAKTVNSNNMSTWTDFKPKGKISTFASSPSRSILKFDNIQQSFEMLKISLKKETDRRNKLRKLLQKYNLIYAQQKKHVKQIKSSIIEMKDANATSKFKILIDPTILVQNQIKVETRQFLCALLNTFYQTYEQNQKNSEAITNLNGTMSFMIKGISYSEDMLFLMQKSQINEQVQLQGELLTQKNKLKQQMQRHKQIKEQHISVVEVYNQAKQKNEKKKKIISDLKDKLKQLNMNAEGISKKIQQKQNIKMQCQDKIDTQLLYQQKLKDQVNIINNELSIKKKQSKKMIKQLFQGKIRLQECKINTGNTGRKNKTLGEQARHKIKFQVLHQYERIRG